MSWRNNILEFFKPLQMWMQHMGASEPLMTEYAVKRIVALAKPGDKLLSYENQRLTSLFIDGDWDHAAIVTSNMTVMEAVGDDWREVNGEKVNFGGVREVPLEQWLYGKDHVALIRNGHLNLLQAIKVGKKSYDYKGGGYDYGFELSLEELKKLKPEDEKPNIYCSELVYLCHIAIDPEFCKGFIKEEILPQLYYDLCDNKNMFLLFEFRGS